MTAVPLNHEEILGMAQARRDRRAAKLADGARRLAAASGTRLPSADELLRGHPVLGEDIRRDIEGFVDRALRGLRHPEATESLRRLAEAARGTIQDARGGDDAILAAIRACSLPPEADPDGTIRLRCVIYAALLGDVDAAHVVAAEAALAAYVQDWHLEGDGSDLVWQAVGWSAFAASRVEAFRPLPYALAEMPSVRDRVDAFAEDFRLKVGRLLDETDRT
ncbi:hypothetical protein [Aureimonas sp. Leaf454]|uniref:hypothetical protein n=1 Tax=Aureimonas sp. Leaf454 TaxID=1736381 RepID=UPI000AD15176|nr:hypothetical protein [Aureimonas sp. Leaf454]